MASAGGVPDGESAPESWIILRPPQILREVPYAFRWEVTRRHPYYLRFWDLARRNSECPSDDTDLHALEQVAALILLTLGISAVPPPPGASAESIGAGDLSQSWEGGAIAPITFRGLINMLIVGLPRELLAQVGRLLMECGEATDPEDEEKSEFVSRLQGIANSALDAIPNRPVVGVNIDAPIRAITEAIENQARHWKEQQGIPERRRRDDKLPEYIKVWDLREGWVTDQYDTNKERKLREIARSSKMPLSTVANHYRSAFRLITGWEYSSQLWFQIMGAHKLGGFPGPVALPRRSLQRPWRERQTGAVPEALLQGGVGRGAAGVLNTISVSKHDFAYLDFALDIQALLEKKRSNAEIIAELDLQSDEAEAVIEYFRARQGELP